MKKNESPKAIAKQDMKNSGIRCGVLSSQKAIMQMPEITVRAGLFGLQ